MNKFAWLCLLTLAAGVRAAPLQHDFVAVDEGLSNLLHVNEANPMLNWIVHLGK